ncbi:MAG TPA: hypothetical protein VK791_09590 [bacterium]|nr:hypothetical protein [bacterium]
MKIPKFVFLFLLWSVMALVGVWVPLACTNTASNFLPTKPSTPVVASATATNAFGYTSTPTFTLQPTGTITYTPTTALTPMTGAVTVCDPSVPNAVALNSAATTLYVAGGDGTLSIYPAGSALVTPVATVTGYNGIMFGDLAGVAVAPSSNYYVLDSGTAAVYEFDNTNAPVTTWNSYNGMAFSATGPPQGIAVDGSGNVYVVDTGNNVVDEFTANGAATVAQWGYSGSGSGYFNDPTGIAVGSGSPTTIYVADMGNGVIQEFSSPGVFVSQIATVLNPAIVLGLAVDSSGDIFAADYNNYEVEKYKAPPPSPPVILTAGAPVTLDDQWTGPALPPGSNFGPAGIAFDGTYLYVADYDNNHVYQVKPH